MQERQKRTDRDAVNCPVWQQLPPGSMADTAGRFQVGALGRSFHSVRRAMGQLWILSAGSASGLLSLPVASTSDTAIHLLWRKPCLGPQLVPYAAGWKQSCLPTCHHTPARATDHLWARSSDLAAFHLWAVSNLLAGQIQRTGHILTIPDVHQQ